MLIKVYNHKTKEEAIKAVSEIDLTKVYHVKITQKRKRRSIDQNALYWLWIACIELETGNDKNDLHDHFKAQYLGGEYRTIFGEQYYKLKSTSKLNTLQFTQYLDKIQVFASSELGIILPNPDDIKFEHFKDFYSKYL